MINASFIEGKDIIKEDGLSSEMESQSITKKFSDKLSQETINEKQNE